MEEECAWWDVSGTPGVDGRPGDLDATEAGAGFDSGDLVVTLSRQAKNRVLAHGTRKLKRWCGTNSSYYMRVSAALNIYSYSPAVYVVFPVQAVTLSAIGGDGGHGANGSDGCSGQRGQDGIAATTLTPATDGGAGAPGQRAGLGSSGGSGGSGGLIEIRVSEYDMDLLSLVSAKVDGGRGGRPGAHGQPGAGGKGGKGGAGLCWVERKWNGWGWDRITHTASSGTDGSDGLPGEVPRHTLKRGLDGVPGKATFVVEYSEGQCIKYQSAFDLHVESFRVSNPRRNRCSRWAPGETLEITDIIVTNRGSMPTPRHTRYSLALQVETGSLLESTSTYHQVPTYILPGETVTLHCELSVTTSNQFPMGDTIPWRKNEVVRVIPSLFDSIDTTTTTTTTIHSETDSLRRHHEHAVLLAHPVELVDFATSDAMYVGQSAMWTCTMRNCMSQMIRRRVSVRLVSLDGIVVVKDQSPWIYDIAGGGVRQEYVEMTSDQVCELYATVHIPPDAPVFQSSSFAVELWLENGDGGGEMSCVQRHVQAIRACPVVNIRLDTDMLLVGGRQSTRVYVTEWVEALKSVLGVRCTPIDTTMEGGVPWALLEQQRFVSDKTILLLCGYNEGLGDPFEARRMMRKHGYRLLVMTPMAGTENAALTLWQHMHCLLTGPDQPNQMPKAWSSVGAFWDSLQAVEHGTSAAEQRAQSLTPEFHSMQDHCIRIDAVCDNRAWLQDRIRRDFPYRSFHLTHLTHDTVQLSFGMDLGNVRWIVAEHTELGNRIPPVIAALSLSRKCEMWRDLVLRQRQATTAAHTAIGTSVRYSHELVCLGECITMDLVVEQLSLLGDAIVLDRDAWRRRLSQLDAFVEFVQRDASLFREGAFYSTAVRVLATIYEIADAAVVWTDYAKHLGDPRASICVRSAVDDACDQIVTCITDETVGQRRLRMYRDIREHRRAIARSLKASEGAAQFVARLCAKYAMSTDQHYEGVERNWSPSMQLRMQIEESHTHIWREHLQKQQYRANFAVRLAGRST